MIMSSCNSKLLPPLETSAYLFVREPYTGASQRTKFVGGMALEVETEQVDGVAAGDLVDHLGIEMPEESFGGLS